VARNLLTQQAGRLLRQNDDSEGEADAPTSPEDVVRGLFGQLLNNNRNQPDETPDDGADDEDGGDAPN
jgi:AsmA protein